MTDNERAAIATFRALSADRADNNSTRKFDLEFYTKPDGALWVRACFKGHAHGVRWTPAFLDLYRIVQAIAVCEDLKYPPPALGREKLVDFLADVVRVCDWSAVARKHQIPERDGDRVVNANGADLSGRRRTPPLDPDVEANMHDDRWIVEQDKRNEGRR